MNVKVKGGNNGVLFSLGQPLECRHRTQRREGRRVSEDVSSLKPADHLKNGDQYAVTGSVASPR